MVGDKSIVVTYLLWLFAGWTGVHHFYLGRDTQCLLWLETFAVFGVGWWRDLFRIPEYVQEANLGSDFRQRLKFEILASAPGGDVSKARPSASWSRLLGQLFFGFWYGSIIGGMLEDFGLPYSFLFAAGFSLGWHTAGTTGYVTAELSKVFLYTTGTCVTGSIVFVLVYGTHMENLTMLCALPAYWAFNGSKKFMDADHQEEAIRGRSRRGVCRRACRNGLIHGLFLLCFTIFTAQNAELKTADGESVKVKHHLKNLYNSPVWGEAAEVFYEFYGHYSEEGWEEAWSNLANQVDIEGEGKARRVLGLKKDASWKEVRSAYRQLAAKWHPDKNLESPAEAEEKFIEIAEAYETLKTIFDRRKRKEDTEL